MEHGTETYQRLLLPVFIAIILHVSANGVVCAEQSHEEQIYNLKLVKEYVNYGSVAVFRFRIPDHVIHAKWFINKIIQHPKDCDDLPMMVSIQAGGLPIVNPYNTSFPPNTRLPHNNAKTFTIPKASSSLMLESHSVSADDWFIVVYREKQDDKIKQKGLSVTCNYYTQATVLFDRLSSLETLSSTGKNSFTMGIESQIVIYKFLVDSNMAAVTFSVADCEAWSKSKSLGGHCPIQLYLQASRIPDAESKSAMCLQNTSTFSCQLEVTPVLRDTWYYLSLVKLSDDTSLTVGVNITVDVTVCEELLLHDIPPVSDESTSWNLPSRGPLNTHSTFSSSLLPDVINFTELLDSETVTNGIGEKLSLYRGYNASTSPASPSSPGPEATDTCPDVDHLSVNYRSGSLSKEFFSTRTNASQMIYSVKNGVPFFASFRLNLDDVGGVLVLQSQIFGEKPLGQNVTSIMCLKRDTPPVWNGTLIGCGDDMVLSENLGANGKVSTYYPFPLAGQWYVAQYATCQTLNRNGSRVDVPCCANLSLEVSVKMTSCIEGCGKNGHCRVYDTTGILMSVCKCNNDYTGWGCTDDSQVSPSDFLMKVLFLTLSNLIFLVDAILALYQRHYPEAVSFVATCFFSTMYHACDSSPVCITDYDTLQFCDFFASFMSILLILIAMARLPQSLKSFLHIVGVYALAFFAQWDRFSLWSIAVPLIGGIIVLLISWAFKMYKRRKLYPSVRRWLLFIIPGTLLAVAGLTINAAVETDSNYYWVHSTWHLCMGLGVLFLMPPKENRSKMEYHPMSELVDVSNLNADLISNDDPGY